MRGGALALLIGRALLDGRMPTVDAEDCPGIYRDIVVAMDSLAAQKKVSPVTVFEQAAALNPVRRLDIAIAIAEAANIAANDRDAHIVADVHIAFDALDALGTIGGVLP